MLLKKIKLENIRSHLNQEINFPDGATLLSGDIGSGKSSILLAIEFALFGLVKGEINGGGLLRKGENKGGVELNFNIGNDEIVVKRNLKKSSAGIVQDSGHVIINGVKREASAVELKQKILELLNYPPELLTKKSLIYRYTVYTPQEEMKNILVGDKGYRLDTLRRVFDIDKYKRIRENAKLIISKLKEKKNEYEFKIEELDEKQEELKLKEKNLVEGYKKLNELSTELSSIKSVVERKKKDIKGVEEELNNLKELKKKFEIGNINLKNKLEKLENNLERIKELNKEISEITKLEIKDFKPELDVKTDGLKKFESNLKEIFKKLNELNFSKEHSNKIIKSILDLDECPTCMQKVSSEHKTKVVSKEKEIILLLNKELLELREKEKELEKSIDENKKEIDRLRKLDSGNEAVRMKKNEIKFKEELRKKLSEEEVLINRVVFELESENKKLSELIKDRKIDEGKIEALKKELEEFVSSERKLDVMTATLSNEVKNSEEKVGVLKKDIKEMLEIKDKLKKTSLLKENIEDRFVGLMEIIEKNVMLRVHYDFDNLFRKWFEMLVDSEAIKVKLDNEFSPLIEQNGYDIDYEYLSGGEKTAAALAYRLALNQVINNLVEGVKTKDLIILDEPTDGFSSEQLDRMKNVLDELDMKQIIIVSHEDKIESFVDNVIRFNKKENVSSIK